MGKEYSIAEAKNHLSEVVHEAENEGHVTLTRRGRPVAVVVSQKDFDRLCSERTGFYDALAAFRQEVDLSDIDADEIFAGLRDRSLGRDVGL